MKKTLLFFLIGLSLLYFYPIFAYVMQSDSYRVGSDSINAGGSDDQSSDSYKMRDTIGEVSSGESTSASFKLKAGYRRMQEVYFSLSSPGNIDMGAIDLTQNSRTGTGDAWNVKTDCPAGYILNLKADTADCLKDDDTGEAFTDYTEATSGVPETWSVDVGNYEFGFSVYGNDVNTATWGSDSTCGTDTTPSTNLKWQGFKGVTAISVASSDSRTSTSGTDTVLCVSAEQNNVYAPSGSYTADITATAVSQ
jgi:hypothetical protein